MDHRAIGVFDSGLGGLTAVRELKLLLPQEDIIYFGDTGRVPYGSRSKETILHYARQDMAFLTTFDLKAILIACGTVSSVAMDDLTGRSEIPVIGVIDPTAERAAAATKNGKIGIIGTKATVQTRALERCILKKDPEIRIFSNSCPLFVNLVENGRFRRGDRVVELIAAEYLEPIRDAGVDTLCLACTHFPLLEDVIGDYMGPDVTLINSGSAGARCVAETLEKSSALNDPGRTGSCRYFVSDTPDGFESAASIFLQQDVRGTAERIDISRY